MDSEAERERLMYCLFCNGEEKNYKPSQYVEFVCSRCVLLLASADEENLRRGLAKAEEKGLLNKVSVIKFFIIEDQNNDRKTKKHQRNMERKRPVRTIRPTHHFMRAQSSAVKLDSRWP